MNFNFKNIKEHPISTAVGIIVLLACFVLPHFMDINFSDTIQVIIIVLTFLFYGNGGTKPLMLLVALSLVTCKPNEKANIKAKLDSLTVVSYELEDKYYKLESMQEELMRTQNHLRSKYEEFKPYHLPTLDELQCD